MGKYIKRFDSHSEYETFSGTSEFVKPNVSFCVDNREVHYSSRVVIPYQVEAKFISYSANEDVAIRSLSYNAAVTSIIVDDVLIDGTPSTYRFNTEGEHSVKYVFSNNALPSGFFYGCNSVISITITDKIHELGSYPFKQCSSLESVTFLSGTPPEINNTTLDYNSSYTIYVPNNSYKITNIWSDLADRIYCELYDAYPEDLVPALEATINVTSTSSDTKIYGEQYPSSPLICINIDGVRLNGVPNTYRFNSTGEHTIEYIFNNPTFISDGILSQCTNVTNISIYSNTETIGKNAFAGCSSLSRVYIYPDWPPSTNCDDGETVFQGVPQNGIVEVLPGNSENYTYWDTYTNELEPIGWTLIETAVA